MASDNFKSECRKRAYKNRLGELLLNDTETPIDNTNVLSSFTIKSGCYVNGEIIGTIYCSELTANIIENVTDLADKKIEARVGVKYADNTTEYMSLGKYTVLRPNNEITANKSQIIAYDDLYTNLDIPYVSNIDYSEANKTIADVYVDVCDQIGLEPITTVFTNSTLPVSNNPFTNKETNRTVLQSVAKAAGKFVEIDIDTQKIDLKWLSTSETPDCIFDYNDGEKSQYATVTGGSVIYGPINSLTIKNSQVDDENVNIKDEESIETNGEHTLIINEDYFLYDTDLRQQAITGIWNEVRGLTYVDCELVTYYGKPFLKNGAKIRIFTDDTNYFDTYLLLHEFTYDGTFKSVIKSPAMTTQEIKTQQSTSLGQLLKNTQIIVNKQNQTITQIVKEQTEQGSQLTQQEMTLDGITTTVSNIQSSLDDYATTEEVSNIIEQTIESTTNIIQKTGGFNLLLNTQWYQDLAEWEVSAANDYSVDYESADVLQNTESKSELNINTATVKQTFQTMIGQTVTISFKYKKAGVATGGNSYVRIYRSDDDYVSVLEATEAQEDRKQVKLTYTSTVNTPTLVINSDRDDFWITDLVIQYGESDIWSPNATETRGQNYSLTLDGLYLKDIASGEEMHLTGNKLQFENGFYGNGEMQTEEGTFTQSLNVCGLTYTYIDDDNVIVN